MKKRNGFTLMELLGVIVLLAIIALIATPMVLKYISNTRESANMVSIEMILRAADIYYSNMLGKNESYPKRFSFPDNENELGLKGRQPDFGQLILYADGTTFLDIAYDDVTYTKNRNEIKVNKNDMVIGDASIWKTDGYGNITNYFNSVAIAANVQTNRFSDYLGAVLNYALGTTTDYFEIDFSKTLTENIERLESAGKLDSSGLPKSLNVEIGELIKVYDSQSSIGEEEMMSLLEQNASTLANVVDFSEKTFNGTDMSRKRETTAYRLIYDYLNTSSTTMIVPNYVKHEDGTLEEITAISGIYLSVEFPKNNMDLIISHGIEKVGRNAFSPYNDTVNKINSVVLPSTITTIESSAFSNNNLTEIILPQNIIEIGANAFSSNKLTTVVIPGSIKKIDMNAFFCSTLTSVIIQKAEGDDLTIGNSAFASATVTYQP